MRGTIIMWSSDKGVVTAAGQRYDFDINAWLGSVAPTANMTVEITVDGGRLTGVKPVDEAEPAKEKLAAIGGRGSAIAKAVLGDVGKEVVVAYAAFALLALFAGMFVAHALSQPITLADALSGNFQRQVDLQIRRGSDQGVLLVLLATATVAVPYFWKHRLAPLAFCIPLAISGYGIWTVRNHLALARGMIESELAKLTASENGLLQFGVTPAVKEVQELLQKAEEASQLGLWGWVLLAVTAFLAFKGVARFLSRS